MRKFILLALMPILAASADVTPAFVNHNRVPGNTPTMTNMQAWVASLVVSGISASTATNIAGQVATNVVPEWARAENPPAAGVTDVTTNGASAVVDGVAHIVFPAPPPTDRISNATHVITADRQFITPTPSPWTIKRGRDGVTNDVTAVVSQPRWENDTGIGLPYGWYVEYSCISDDDIPGPPFAVPVDRNADKITWMAVNLNTTPCFYTATRTLASTTLLATTNEVCAVSNYVAALIAPLNPTFSNAVAVVVDYSANNAVTAAVDAQLTAILGGNWKTLYGGGLAGLIAALVAALTWLKTNKVGSFSAVGGQTPTVQNGVADLSTLFASGNTSLVSTITTTVVSIYDNADTTNYGGNA